MPTTTRRARSGRLPVSPVASRGAVRTARDDIASTNAHTDATPAAVTTAPER